MSTLIVKRTYYSPMIRRLIIAAIVIAVGIGIFTFLKRRGQTVGETTYEFGQVTRGDVRSSVTATGVIQPWKTVDIKSNVAGKIMKLHVDLGDVVKMGDPIMDIDPTDPQTALSQAQADLDAAIARKTQAQLNAEQERTQAVTRVNSARRAVESAKARLAQAQSNSEAQPILTSSTINQAQAALASARTSVTSARESRNQLQEQLKQLQEVTIPLNLETVKSNVDEAKANLTAAEADYNRQNALLKKGYVAKSDVETAYAQFAAARATARTADQRQDTIQRENQIQISQLNAQIAEAQSRIASSLAQVRQSEAALKLARTNGNQVDIREQDVKAAEAAVQQAQAELASAIAQQTQVAVRLKEVTAANSTIVRGQAAVKQAVTNLGYTRILAPRSGVIITKNVEEGTVVPSSRGSIGSTDALIQIGDTSKLWISCLVDETDVGQINVGQNVNVRVDAYPSMLVDGKVIRIDPQAKVEQNVTMIPVTVEIIMPDDRFKPVMNAECEFIVEESKNTLAVPNEALKEEDGEYSVQKMVAGKPKDFPVEVGVAGPDLTEIKSGLKEGETVITKTIAPEEAETNNPFGGPFGGRRGGNKKGGNKK